MSKKNFFQLCICIISSSLMDALCCKSFMLKFPLILRLDDYDERRKFSFSESGNKKVFKNQQNFISRRGKFQLFGYLKKLMSWEVTVCESDVVPNFLSAHSHTTFATSNCK